MQSRRLTYWFALIVVALLPALALAKSPKKYQVTGKVLEVSADLIVVDKDGEKFEISRSADTKVTGDLKVGAKVTIEYQMSAGKVEVKDAPAEKKK